ncbi:MAG: OmpA family protein [Candidatus Kapaibacterium sp.]
MNTKKLLVAALSLLSVLAIRAVPVTAQMDVSIGLRGTVVDETTRKPALVGITVTDASGRKVTSTKTRASDGSYYVVLKPGVSYTMTFDGEGFFKESRQLEIPPVKKYAEITRDWVVHIGTVGTKLRPAVSPFEYKKSKLRVGSDQVLASYVSLMKTNPGATFEIRCFPDVESDSRVATEFTAERANTLKSYLVQNGVAAERLTVTASSGIDPENPVPQGRAAKGRRYVGPSYFVVSRNDHAE